MPGIEEKIKTVKDHIKELFRLFEKQPTIGLLCLGVLCIVCLIWVVYKSDLNSTRGFTVFIVTVSTLIIIFLVASAFALFKQGSYRPTFKGRYFIGIDLGRSKIEYCLIDYEEFKKNPNGSAFKIYSGIKRTVATNFEANYRLLITIIDEISKKAKPQGIKHIDGIGVGLPGQVDLVEGILIGSPGFQHANNKDFVNKFRKQIESDLEDMGHHPEIFKEDIPIKIDNDVRCATRYLWKSMRFKDGICILLGNGLGSGIVLGGRLLYGHNFMAGEIGHTTICCSICCKGGNLLHGNKCSCDTEGYHWEMYASSHGITKVAKLLDKNEYMRLKSGHRDLIRESPYAELLEREPFRSHSREHFYGNDVGDVSNELTSYFFSLAYHAGDKYAQQVVDKFLEYLAVGIANYINVINPEAVYLGGGMISGFFNDDDNVETEVHNKVRKFVLHPARNVTISRLSNDPNASIGAALIFHDDSYPGNVS